MMRKKRIAFIVQRYGVEVNGGAEYHCRILAEKLSGTYEVDVLTSSAKDYRTWENVYTAKQEYISGVNVLRFKTEFPRNDKKFRSISRKFAYRKPYLKLVRLLGLTNLYEKILPSGIRRRDCKNWLKYQGPYLPDLISYLKKEQNKYDALIFFTYLYYPTIVGIEINPGKSILIPTAHDEPPIYFPVFEKLFHKPAAILYNTAAEKRFVNGKFHNEEIYSDIVGIGVDETKSAGTSSAVEILDTKAPYLVYIGRIDASKGCEMMCDYFMKYKEAVNNDLKLVLIGQAFMDIPVNPDIISLGFVDEQIKLTILEGARALIIPSFYESLSMVTLESMAHGIPVIANGNCEVLKDHIDNSEAGFTFTDLPSFTTALDICLSPETDLSLLRQKAKLYIQKNYNWDVVMGKINSMISYISDRNNHI